MNKPRILHVIDHIYPILGYQETFLAKVHSRENETMVITSDRYSEAIYDANMRLLGKRILGSGLFIEDGLRIMRLPVRLDIRLLNSPWLIGLENAVTNFEPDVIIAHGLVNLTSIRLAMLKPKLKSSKLIFDDHMTYNATRGGWTSWLYKLFKLVFNPFFIKSASAFVAVTDETKEFMHKMYGIPSERIKMIPLGIDKDYFYYDPRERFLIRKKYEIGDDEVVFIYVGKIIPEKGIHLLIDAALQICMRNDRVKFMIIGGNSPSYLARLKQKIEGMKMGKKFFFKDAVPNQELYRYYSAADAGVWPLQCSITMLEATACGLPTVISDKCGAQERVAFGNGLLYKESDPNDLARKLVQLLDSTLRKQMSQKALAYAATLSWDELAMRFLDLPYTPDFHNDFQSKKEKTVEG
jgi:glycosyltransferase involved in cell wall biosynthesis